LGYTAWMNLQVDIRSFFLVVAAIQATIFSLLLVWRSWRNHRLSDRLLALFLIALAATLSEHIAGWMNWYQGQRLTFFPFGNNFLFAPLAYLYVKSITNNAYRFRRKEWFHFIPAMIYFTFHLTIWVLGVERKIEIIQHLNNYYYFYTEGTLDLLVLTYYLMASIQHYQKYLKWIPSAFSNLPLVSLTWLRNFLIILAAVCTIEWAFSLTSLIVEFGYGVRYWDYFIRAILLYFLSIAGFTYSQRTDIVFKDVRPEEIKYDENKSRDGNVIIKQKIMQHMVAVKPYLDPELTLSQLSQQTELPTPLVSQTINAGMGKNFNDFINEYRVQEICLRLNNDEHKTKTLLGVGLDCGFNSKATFNRSFKKVTGVTPREWLENQNTKSQII